MSLWKILLTTLLLVWWSHLVFAYTPTGKDRLISSFLRTGIVDTHRDDWTDIDKQTYRVKIVEVRDNQTDDRMIWFLNWLLTYRDSKPLAKKSESSVAEEKLADVLYQVIVKDSGPGKLRVRLWPSTSNEIIGWVDTSDVLDVLAAQGEWYQIFRDKKLWRVAGEFVEKYDGQTIVASDDDSYKKVEVSPNDVWFLRVRIWPSIENEILWELVVWDQVDVYEEKEAFFRINYEWSWWWIAVNYVHLAGTEAPTYHLTEPSPPAPLPKGEGSTSWFREEFLNKYWSSVNSKDEEILWLCTKYYDEIDAIAREYDFPVELIIATWYREHTCKFFNPWNGWGNFQITSNYYTPGDITWAEFREQVIDFIEFSRAKWNYYDAIQTYGPEPIDLTYNEFDLTSIRKQSILYNGITGELDDNKYANQNFWWIAVWGADGIVTMFLKVLKWGLER